MSKFTESVEEMIASHFAFDARLKVKTALQHEPNNWMAVEEILSQLIRTSIAHARSQIDGRKTGTMSFDKAMHVAANGTMVARPVWGIMNAVFAEDGPIFFWRLDNCDGMRGGDGWPYKPTDEDRTATDWMLYQAPEENWVELRF